MAQEHYDRLGIQPGATEREVRRAYRALLFELEEQGMQTAEYPEKRRQLDEAFEFCLERAQPNVGAEPGGPTLEPGGTSKGTQRIALRLGIGLIAIAALFVGWQALRERLVDPYGDSPADTKGWVAAIEETPQGTRAVAFKPDGTKVEMSRPAGGATDTEVVWRPDGDRLFVISSREGASFDVFRWNPVDGRVERRSVGSRAKSALYFGPAGWPGLENSGLVVSGGSVFAYNQREQSLEQVLPPQFKERRTVGGSADAQGTVGQMEALYKEIGTSFVRAYWGRDRKWVWAVMGTETGQALVYQPLVPPKLEDGTDGPFPSPSRLVAADRIELTVDKDGQAFVVAHGEVELDLMRTAGYSEKYQAELAKRTAAAGLEAIASESERTAIIATIEDGVEAALQSEEKQATDARAYFVVADGGPAGSIQPLYGLAGPGRTFEQPAASPSDDRVLIVAVLEKGPDGKPARSLVIISRSSEPVGVTVGDVSDPAWSADGQSIVFINRDQEGKKGVFVANLAGKEMKQVGKGGDYSRPAISPKG